MFAAFVYFVKVKRVGNFNALGVRQQCVCDVRLVLSGIVYIINSYMYMYEAVTIISPTC